jgi:hypothetical protein
MTVAFVFVLILFVLIFKVTFFILNIVSYLTMISAYIISHFCTY